MSTLKRFALSICARAWTRLPVTIAGAGGWEGRWLAAVTVDWTVPTAPLDTRLSSQTAPVPGHVVAASDDRHPGSRHRG